MANWKNKINLYNEFEAYNDQKLTLKELVDILCKRLKETFSDNEDINGAVTGFKAPKCGVYKFEYHAGMVTNGSLALLLVNGHILARSASWSMDLQEAPAIHGRQLTKSFKVHLNACDVVSLIIVTFITDDFFINTYLDESDFRYLTTMSIELQDPDECNPNHAVLMMTLQRAILSSLMALAILPSY